MPIRRAAPSKDDSINVDYSNTKTPNLDIIATLERMVELEPGLKAIVDDFVQSWPYVDDRVPANIALVGMQYSGIAQLAKALLASDPKRPEQDMVRQEHTHEGEGYTLVQMPHLRDPSWSEGVAWRGLRSTDMVLYVHNAKQDALQADADLFLRRLAAWAPYERWRSAMVVPVLTHCDALSAQRMNALSLHINAQWRDVLGVEPMGVFCVRARHYMAAREARDDAAMAASKIPTLRDFLAFMSHPERVTTLRKAREHMMLQRIAQVAVHQVDQTRVEFDACVDALKSESSHICQPFAPLPKGKWRV